MNLLYGENPNKAVRAFTKPFNEVGIKTHMLDRGLNALRMNPVPADVRQLMYKVKHAQGVDITRIFCGLNDPRNIIPSIKWAKEAGMTAQATMCMTYSKVHTVEYYINLAEQLIEGGAQERGKRAGTENIPGIVSMAAALKEACDHIDENAAKVSALRDKLIAGLRKIPHSALNGDPVHRLPTNVNFCFEGIEGESLLLLLDQAGICASSGSACTSGSLDPSHVLLAIGRPHEVAHGSLRLSLCHDTTEAQVDYILEKVPGIVAYLRDMSPMWKDLESGKRTFIL